MKLSAKNKKTSCIIEIVTLNDMHIGNNYKGIQCLNLKDFLEMEI